MKIVQEIEQQKWSDFVYQHPCGNIFHTPEMYEVFTKTKNHNPVFLAAIDEQGDVWGVLLAVVQKEGKGVIGSVSARSIIWGGPLIKNDDPEVLKLILGAYDKSIKKIVLYSQFRNLWDSGYGKDIFSSLGYAFQEHFDIFIDLNKPEEALWQELDSKKRNEIRRASKENTLVLETGDIEQLYNILKEVYKNARLPLADISLFKSAFRILGSKGMIKCFGAFNNGEIIGIMCVLIYKGLVYNWYAGARRKFFNKYPNDLLPWEVLRWGKANGFATFDWGGAGKPNEKYGVREHKKQFGGRLVNYGRFQKIHQLGKFKLAKLGFKIWRRIK